MLKHYYFIYEQKKLMVKHQLNTTFNLSIDFFNPQLQWRLKTLTKQQIFAKSLGLHKQVKYPYVIDATAGLGNDSLSMLQLGCRVKMIESSPFIFALLKDALFRAKEHPLANQLNFKQLSLRHDDSTVFLKKIGTHQRPDIIYLDPMFPQRTKSAKIKQDMRALQDLAQTTNNPDLLKAALVSATRRVVVKRAKQAPHLTQDKPTSIYHGKSIRYDVYHCHQPA